MRVNGYPTPFSLVSDMNTAFSNPKGDPQAIDLDRLRKQIDNIAGPDSVGGEVGELYEALAVPDLDQIRDSLCDIMVFALGAYHLMGLDADADMAEVVRAVRTRLCRDAAHVEETQEFYRKLGVQTYQESSPAGGYAVKSLNDQTDTNGEYYPKGKFLKAVGYEQPSFRQPG